MLRLPPRRSVACPAVENEPSRKAKIKDWFYSDGVTMTPEDFAAKVEEMRAAIADKIAELEENPAWGNEDGRQEVIQALDELVVQAQALSELLQQDVDEDEGVGEEP
jgi:ClpP class serine protease